MEIEGGYKQKRAKITYLFFKKQYRECFDLCEELLGKAECKEGKKESILRRVNDLKEVEALCLMNMGEYESALPLIEQVVSLFFVYRTNLSSCESREKRKVGGHR